MFSVAENNHSGLPQWSRRYHTVTVPRRQFSPR